MFGSYVAGLKLPFLWEWYETLDRAVTLQALCFKQLQNW